MRLRRDDTSSDIAGHLPSNETVSYTEDDTPYASETKPFRFACRRGLDHLYGLPGPFPAENMGT
ncbi:hypothetical protein GCM10010286_37100 [Streptomyces toxytricini]|nr:hypothetical protein GCM10010286_37100 [Streptomyces toxytricini]